MCIEHWDIDTHIEHGDLDVYIEHRDIGTYIKNWYKDIYIEHYDIDSLILILILEQRCTCYYNTWNKDTHVTVISRTKIHMLL